MPDTIGNITVPDPVTGSAFPLVTEFPHEVGLDYQSVVHSFGSSNRKIEQRYLLGTGARVFTVNRSLMSETERDALRDHWEDAKGGYKQFDYDAPEADQTTTTYTVRYANEPLVWSVRGPRTFAAKVTLIEVPSSPPSYSVSATLTRFPSGGLATTLLGQAHVIIPLVKITPKESGYPAIYLSDRRVTVGGQLYQARLLEWDGISQSMGSAADDVSLTFGNADLVMTQLAADVDLNRAAIEFSLFHVGATTLINLWKGELVTWEEQEGSPEFRVRASDIVYDLTLPYPLQVISRECWKEFDDGNGCPYTAQGTLDLVNFPSATALACDKGWITPNGCKAHGMLRYHGGIQAEPQGVQIKNNATGTWGIGRAMASASSIINDSAYGEVLQEIYTDSDMPVQATVVAGRDESDYYEGLGVIGRGPITFATPTGLSFHTLDGQPHHGHPGALGLRTIPGTDPAGATDFLSLDQSGNQVGGDINKIYSGSSTYKNVFAAGVAALVIRRSDEKGIQLSRPSEHQMTPIIAEGLQGWIWSGAGSRTLDTLTNPVWVVINMHIRALGLQFASAATCEEYFDVAAAVAAASICDSSVSRISGLSGSETQFKFRGVVRDRRPVSDWMDDVLSNCLGYRVNNFGRLKIGVRVNSSTVEAFTVGNMLADSLKLSPVRPTFNHIVAEFNDELYGYQRNTISVEATDHKKLIGGSSSPKVLPVSKQLVGTCGASQAGRIIATMLKEELGGADLAEWRKARIVRFRTTILALNVEPGMVCSLTHERMPSGAGEFRVLGWRLNSDMSIDIEGKTTTDGMYDLAAGPKPADVLPSALPIEQVQYPRRPGLMPGINPGSGSDPVQGQYEYAIGVTETYEEQADGTSKAAVGISTVSPINQFLDVPATIIRGLTATAGGGASLPVGNWFAACAPYKNSGPGGASQYGPPSNTLAITTSSTGKITIGSITWPAAPSGSWDGYAVLCGPTEQEMCLQKVASAPPTSIDITVERRFSGGLQPNALKVRGKVKLCPWPGVSRAAVSSVTGTTIVCSDFAGGGDAFSGRRLQVISDASDGTAGIWNFSCSAYNEPTGTFTVTPDPSAIIGVGDMLVVLTAPSSTSTTVTDTKWNFTTDELIGRLVRILHGTGRGQSRLIVANTATAITIEQAWAVNPDSTSVVVVEESDWVSSAESSDISNLSGSEMTVSVPMDNPEQVVVLTAGFLVDRFGQEAPESATPMRLLFISGSPGTGPAAPPDDVQPIGADDFLVAATVEDDPTGLPRLRVEISYDPPAVIGGFIGVRAHIEAPESSGFVQSIVTADYNGDPMGSGSARYGTLTFFVPVPEAIEDWRFLLTSRSNTYDKELVLSGAGETPSVILEIDPGTIIPVGPPALPLTVVGSEVTRGQDATSHQLRVKVRATMTYPVGHTATGVTVFISWDNGTTWEFGCDDEAKAQVDFWVAAPATDETDVKLRVITWGDNGSNDPEDAVVSAAFTIVADSLVPANSITNAVQVGSITYNKANDGAYYWGFTITFTNPSNANLFVTKLTVQKTDASGNAASDPEGVERPVDEWMGLGRAISFTVASDWTLPYSSAAHRYFRLRLYCVNQHFQENLQTTAWSGASYLQLAPAEPTGASGIEFAPLVTSPGVTVVYDNDEQGAQVWRLQTSASIPGDPVLGGYRIILRNTSTSEETTIGEASRTVGVFNSGNLPIRSASVTYDVYFVSFDTSGRSNTLVPGTTPKVTITVVRQVGSSGQEAAALVTGFTASANTGFGEDGGQVFWFEGGLTPPADTKYKGALLQAALLGSIAAVSGSPTMTRVSGPYFFASHVGQRLNVAGATHTITAVNTGTQQVTVTPSWGSSSGTWVNVFIDELRTVGDIGPTATFWTSDKYPINHDSESWRIYAISYDYSGRENTLVPGTTPSADVTVARSVGTTGREYADVISGIVIDNGGSAISVSNESGVLDWIISGSVTEPSTDPRFGGFRVMRLGNLGDPMKNIEIAFVARGSSGKFRSTFQPTQAGVTSLVIFFLSVDTSGRTNSYSSGVTPEVTVPVPSQGNTLNLAKVLPGSLVTSAFAAGLRPIAIFSSNPSLPHSDYPAGSYGRNTTTGEFLRVNSAGNTWVKAIDGGLDIVADSITSATIAAGAVSTSELFAGEILVGSGGGKPTRFRVNDSGGNMVGFIGDNGAGFVGAYFVHIRVGSNINSPFMYADGTSFRLGPNAISFANFYVDPTQAVINNMPITVTTSGITTSINHEAYSTGRQGLTVSTNVGVSVVRITPGNITFLDDVSGFTKVFLNAPSGSGASFALYNSSGQQNFRVTCNFSGTYPTVIVSNGVTPRTGQTWTRTFALAGGGSYTQEVVGGIIVSS